MNFCCESGNIDMKSNLGHTYEKLEKVKISPSLN